MRNKPTSSAAARRRLTVFRVTAAMLALIMLTPSLLTGQPPAAPVPLGAAVAAGPLGTDERYRETLRGAFRTLTPENAMKLDALQPEPGRYDFRDADRIVDFARANGMTVRGHTLVWHRALPSWLTRGSRDRAALTALLRDHIFTTVGRYRGRVAAWDVVNEAVADDGTLRDSLWRRGIGPEYIELAFRWAHQADPGARLYYNDYGGEGLGRKSGAIYALLRDLRARGVPLHGVGLQMHVSLGAHPEPRAVEQNARRLARLGLEVAVTEMDVRVGDGAGPPEQRLRAQAELYAAMLAACRASKACRSFTTWGVTDRYFWNEGAPPGGEAPLLFDGEYRPKPAFWALGQGLGAP